MSFYGKTRIRKMNIRKLNLDDKVRISEELISESFLNGIKTAINYTKKHGLETGFVIKYIPEKDSHLYPDEIKVGLKDKVRIEGYLNIDKSNKKYKKDTGLPLPISGNKEWGIRFKELTKSNKTHQAMKEISNGIDWLNKNKILYILYPKSNDWENKNDMNYMEWVTENHYEDEYYFPQFYSIAFHY